MKVRCSTKHKDYPQNNPSTKYNDYQQNNPRQLKKLIVPIKNDGILAYHWSIKIALTYY